MPNLIRFKRRASGGAAGAPVSLKTSEPAYNETDDILYIGYGDDGSGNATSIRSLAGVGAFLALLGNQTVAGVKTFSSTPIVPDAAYDATGWNGSNEVPTKNAVRDKIEALAASGVSDGNKGDIVVSGSGTVYTINTDVVDNTKLANMATKTYKGRTSGTTGDPEDVSAATLKADLSLDNVTNESKATMFTNPALTGTPTAPTAGAGTNTTQIASTAYVIAEILARLASNDAMLYKGAIDASTNPNYPAADAGFTYRFSVAGKIGGASGPNVEVGDIAICHVDSSAAGTQAGVGANWDIIQLNIDGALTTGSIGVTVQAYNANLTTYAGIAPSANVQSILGGANYAAVRTLLGLVIGTNVQAWDADLDTWATKTAPAGVVLGDTSTIDGGTF